MKESKPVLLILLSVGLIITWVYHLYDKSIYSGRTREVYIKDSTAVAEAVSDSLKKIFSRSLEELETDKLLMDSANSLLQGELRDRLSEINRLRYELKTILKKRNLTQNDLIDARYKISDLQARVEGLRGQNDTLITEREKLNGILEQLSGEVNTLQRSISRVNSENEALKQKINEASTFVASNIRFAAVQVRGDQKETETLSQKRAAKFVISFDLQNNAVDFPATELVTIIKDPNGRTLNPEVWDAGSFETRTEGRKAFTRKIKLEYIKGETKKIAFSIQPESFDKGQYRFYLYHNGIRIGASVWKLN